MNPTVEQQKRDVLEWMGWPYSYPSPEPNLSSLDEIARVEAMLKDGNDKWECRKYVENLKLAIRISNGGLSPSGFGQITAKAPQRLEALHRTLFPERWEK